MGRTLSVAFATMLVAVAWGCDGGGDGDADVDADVDVDADGDGDGDTDVDGDGDVDADEEVEPVTVRLVVERQADPEAVYLQRGSPLEGAFVALETTAGRTELRTDAAGAVDLVVPAGEPFTYTVAAPGHTVVSQIGVTEALVGDFAEAHGEYFLLLWPFPEPTPIVRVTVEVTGIGAGDLWWVAAEAGRVSSVDAATTAVLEVPARGEPMRVLAGRVEETGVGDHAQQVTDVVVVELEDTLADRAVAVAFDGAAEHEVVVVEDLAVLFPGDPESVFRAEGLWANLGFPANALEWTPFLPVGLSINQRATGDGVTLDLARVVLGDEPIGFIVQAYTARSSSTSWMVLPEPPEPGATYPLMDVPRLTSPRGEVPNLGATFAWQEVDGARASAVSILSTDESRTLWVAVSHLGTSGLVLPALPAAFDPEPDWGRAGGSGRFRPSVLLNPLGIGCSPDSVPTCEMGEAFPQSGPIELGW